MQVNNKCLNVTVEEFNYNVQKIRFLAAVFVIIGHAWSISGAGQEPLALLTKGNIGFGKLSVYTFMFLSGLYAARTIHAGGYSERCRGFLLVRIRRLCPSLFATVLLTVFIIGPMFTSLPIEAYFSSRATWGYFLNCIFIVRHKLPGVFENNVYTGSINGSLWSLPLEALCCVALIILFKLRLLSEEMSVRRAVILILGGELFIRFIVKCMCFIQEYRYHLHLCLVFLLGALCFLLREKIYLNRQMQIVFVMLLPVLIYFNVSSYIWIYLFLYVLLVLCFAGMGRSTYLSSLGKYSYEIYLVGFLMQQCICYFFGGSMNPWMNIALSVPLAIIVGGFIHKTVQYMRKLKFGGRNKQ